MGLLNCSSLDVYITETRPIAATAKVVVVLLLLTGYRQHSTFQRPQHLPIYLPTHLPASATATDKTSYSENTAAFQYSVSFRCAPQKWLHN